MLETKQIMREFLLFTIGIIFSVAGIVFLLAELDEFVLLNFIVLKTISILLIFMGFRLIKKNI